VLAREFLAMSQAEFSARFQGSAMKRAKRRGLARNAAVVLGNVGTSDDVPMLEAALAHDEPLVREHALGRCAASARAIIRPIAPPSIPDRRGERAAEVTTR
jgi:epoxyqueuosine reductase